MWLVTPTITNGVTTYLYILYTSYLKSMRRKCHGDKSIYCLFQNKFVDRFMFISCEDLYIQVYNPVIV